MSFQKILVYGATGVQGSAVLRQLLATQKYQVRGLARDEAEANSLREQGAEAVIANFDDAQSLQKATEGVDAVFLVMPLIYDHAVITQYARHAIDAARLNGVKYIVFNTSTRIPNAKTDIVGFESKREIEAYLKASGIPATILRPTFYMQNFAGPWTAPAIIQQSVVAYPVPADIQASWISIEDAAQFAVVALEHPELAGSTFNIGGPEQLNGQAISERFSRAFGRAIAYVVIPPKDFEAGLAQVFGANTAFNIAEMYRWMEKNITSELFITDTQALYEKLPITPTTLENWIQAHAWAIPEAP